MKKFFTLLRNKTVLKVLVTVLFVALSTGAFLYIEKTQNRVFIDNSQVSAPIIVIAPETPGLLTQLSVYENETVKKGDALAVVGSQTVYSESDGLILSAPNQLGSVVGTQNPLIQMINKTDMRIAGTIDEDKGLSAIKVGQPASFIVDALPGKTFWGFVDEIAPSAKQTQIAFSISSERPTQQFIVYTKFNAAAYPEIKNGMSAKMIIYTR